MSKTLYFEGAGWSGADSSKATIGNCRIRTAFHLDPEKKHPRCSCGEPHDGAAAVYLEIICGTIGKETGSSASSLPTTAGLTTYTTSPTTTETTTATVTFFRSSGGPASTTPSRAF